MACRDSNGLASVVWESLDGQAAQAVLVAQRLWDAMVAMSFLLWLLLAEGARWNNRGAGKILLIPTRKCTQKLFYLPKSFLPPGGTIR